MNDKMTRYYSFWICLILTLTILVVFYQVHSFGFVNYDDPDYVSKNPHVLNGLTADAVSWAFTTSSIGYLQPLTWLSLMLDCQLFGPNPGRIHLINVLLHLANTLLLFVVLKKMTGSLWPSAFVAAAFALHPMHVESVAWIAERKDVLSTFFWILTLLAYVVYVSRPSVFRYIAALAAFALGLMAKPMLVTLPFVLLLLDYWPLNRLMPQTIAASGRRRRKSVPAADEHLTLYRIIIEKIPFFALSVISSVVTLLTQQSNGIVAGINILPLKNIVANAFLSYAKYIGKMFWPQDLAVHYPFNAVSSITLGQFVPYILLLLVISVLVIYFGHKRRYLPVGWFWFVGTLIPVIGLVRFTGSSYADRFTYIPYIGLFIMIAWGLPELLSKWPYRKMVLWTSSLIVLFILTVLTYLQLQYWTDSITLYRHALAVTKNNYAVHFGITQPLLDQGRIEEAIWHSSEAVRIKPDSADALNALGVALREAGRVDEAVVYYKKAIEIDPRAYEANANLGFVLASRGKFAEAIEYYEIAMKTMETPRIHRNYAWALFNLGRFEQAIAEYRKTLLLMPNDPNVLNEFGYALAHSGKFDEAITLYNKALQIKPDFADAHINIGYALTIRSNLDQAAVHLSKALQLDPNSALAHYYFGNILVKSGKINEAVTHFEKALQLKPDWVELMNAMAWCLAVNEKTAVHNPDKAVKLAQRACELTGYKIPELLDTLAVAYAAKGDFKKAVDTSQNALELCRSPEQETLKNEIQNRLILYKAGKPYIEK
jgi:Flp pilus assembly protein TadD